MSARRAGTHAEVSGVERNDLLQLLQRVSQMVAENDVSALVVVGVKTDGETFQGVSAPGSSLYPLLGTLEAVKVQMAVTYHGR